MMKGRRKLKRGLALLMSLVFVLTSIQLSSYESRGQVLSSNIPFTDTGKTDSLNSGSNVAAAWSDDVTSGISIHRFTTSYTDTAYCSQNWLNGLSGTSLLL